MKQRREMLKVSREKFFFFFNKKYMLPKSKERIRQREILKTSPDLRMIYFN